MKGRIFSFYDRDRSLVVLLEDVTDPGNVIPVDQYRFRRKGNAHMVRGQKKTCQEAIDHATQAFRRDHKID